MSEGLRFADDLIFPSEVVTQKIGIFGQSGSGKSYAAMKLAELMLGAGAQVIVLDAVGVWWGLRVAADGAGPGFPITVFGGERGDLPLPPGAAGLVAGVLAARGISAVLDIAEYELPDHKRFVRDFAEAFFQAKKGHRTPVHLFLEEAQVLAPMNPDRDETTMLNRVERLARIGRNYGIGWTLISQRPQDVHTKVRNQAGTLLALRTIGTHERKAIGEWVSDKARSKDEASLTERLDTLPTGTALVWSPSFLNVARTVEVLARTTFDSSATPEFGGQAVAPVTLAPVDVAALRDSLAAAVEEAEANDPAALRRRIAELERQVRARVIPSPEPVVRVDRVEVPVIPPGLRAEVAYLGEQYRWMEENLKTAQGQCGMLGIVLRRVEELVAETHISTELPRPSPPPPPPAPVAAPPSPIAPSRPQGASVPQHGGSDPYDPRAAQKIPDGPMPTMAELRARQRRGAVSVTADESKVGTVKLAGGERKILTVLAQYPQGRTRVQTAILAGYSSGGGGYGNLLGALRSKGLIAGSDPLRITDAGRAALGEWEALPTGRALLEYWCARLGKMPRAILVALASQYPRAVSREEVAASAGYEPSGGAFSNAVGRLKTLDLVEQVGRELRASPVFFAESGGR